MSRVVFLINYFGEKNAHQLFHQKLNGTESQRTPKEVTRAIRYSCLGVRSVGHVGDFLE